MRPLHSSPLGGGTVPPQRWGPIWWWGELPVEVVVLVFEMKWSAPAVGVTLVVLVSSGA